MSKQLGFTTAKGFHASDGTALDLTKDTNGVLKDGEDIISRKRLLATGLNLSYTGSSSGSTSLFVSISEDEFNAVAGKRYIIKGYFTWNSETNANFECKTICYGTSDPQYIGGPIYVRSQLGHLASTRVVPLYVLCSKTNTGHFKISFEPTDLSNTSPKFTDKDTITITDIYEIIE